jgi:hypothetical protein
MWRRRGVAEFAKNLAKFLKFVASFFAELRQEWWRLLALSAGYCKKML